MTRRLIYGTRRTKHCSSARIATRHDGKIVYFRLANDGVLDVLAALRKVAERNVTESSVMLSEFDPMKEIVADCRGAFCILSYEAVAALRAVVFKHGGSKMDSPSGVPLHCLSQAAAPRNLTGAFAPAYASEQKSAALRRCFAS